MENAKILCWKFKAQEAIIKQLIREMYTEENAAKKASLINRLMKEVRVLLYCEHYSPKPPNCKRCRNIARWYMYGSALIAAPSTTLKTR